MSESPVGSPKSWNRMLAPGDRNVFLSTLPASNADRRLALVVVSISIVLFVLAVPYAGVPLTPVPAFVASYQSALAVNDIITAVLLYSQFGALRRRALLLLATGSLFTAAAAFTHALSFPGLFTPQGLLGGGSQTTVWLYMIWHGVFPLLVLGYALSKDRDGGPRIGQSAGRAILSSVAAVVIAMTAFSWLVTERHDALPTLLSGGRYTVTMIVVVCTVWCFSLAALTVLYFRTPHSVIDVWLMVVLCAWLFDRALVSIGYVARFDLGFYAGRIYGLCAASLVLAVLLVDNVALQAQMSRLVRALRRQSAIERDQHTERERLFSAVVESSNDSIIAIGLEGGITAWNKAAERLFGDPADEGGGQDINLIIPPGRQSDVSDILSRLERGERVEQFETHRVRKSSAGGHAS